VKNVAEKNLHYSHAVFKVHGQPRSLYTPLFHQLMVRYWSASPKQMLPHLLRNKLTHTVDIIEKLTV